MPDPLILIDPVQQNDFTARAIAFPNDPLPGNLVDGEFAHIRSILGVAVNILQGITSPDGLSIGQVIGLDQLTPGALDALAQTVVDAVAADTSTATGAAAEATVQAGVATTKATAATAAATAAVAALTVIEGAQAATVAAISALTPSAQESADNAENSATAAETAKEAAETASSATLGLVELAGAWAEHMPGTIPPEVLAAMAVTGDHWSSRWWANQAALVVSAVTDLANNAIDLTSDFNKIYLGPKDEDPSFDNEGQPLLVGAMYFNEITSTLRIWSGTVWSSSTGADSFVINADNLGGGLEVFKDRVTGVLNFRTITPTEGLAATQTANEIQLSIYSVAWDKLTGVPTTLAGHGISDAYTKPQIDAELDAADAAIAARATISSVSASQEAQDAAIALRVQQTSAAGSAVIPAGTTAQRNGSPSPGNFRFNSSLSQWEGWNGAAWIAIGADLSAYVKRDGTLAMTGLLTVNVADSMPGLLVAGATKGVRIVPGAAGSAIEGVDSTGVGSYQPLNIKATALTLDASLIQASGSMSIQSADPQLLMRDTNHTAGKQTFKTANSSGYWYLQSVNDANSAWLRDHIRVWHDGGIRLTGTVEFVEDPWISKAWPQVILNKSASGEGAVVNGALNGSTRWQMRLGSDHAETGSDTGSDFDVLAFSDAGAYKKIVLSIKRDTYKATFSDAVEVGGVLTIGGNAVYHAGNLAGPVTVANFLGLFSMRKVGYGQIGPTGDGNWVNGAAAPAGTVQTSMLVQFGPMYYYAYYATIQWAWNGTWYTMQG